MKRLDFKSAVASVAVKLLVAQIVVAIAALVTNIFSARVLGPESRGELALFMQIAYVANAVAVLGRPRAYLKLVSAGPVSLSRAHKDVRALSRSPLVISLVISMIILLLGGDGVAASLVLAFGFFTLIYSGIQQKTHRSAAIIARKATAYLLSTMVGQILLLASVVLLAFYNVDDVSIWLVVYGTSVLLPYFVVGALIAWRGDEPRSSAHELEQVKRLGLKLMPLSAAEITGARLDRFLIPLLANFSQLGIYTVVVTMTELVTWPVKNYADSKVPQWSKEIFLGRFNACRKIVGGVICVAVMSVAVGAFLEVALVPLFGSEFAAGAELIWPLVLAAALHSGVQMGVNLNLAAGYTTLANSIPLASMSTSAVLYYFFIPTMGALGAAWGLALGYMVGILVSTIGIAKIVRKNGSRNDT